MKRKNNVPSISPQLFDMDAEVIHAYSRAQAIDDGVLVDITKLAKQAGFVYPIAMTAAAWSDTVESSIHESWNYETDRAWDVLNLLRFAVRSAGGRASRIDFGVQVERGDVSKYVPLKAICGPGDNLEPVITIMLPDED